MKNRGIVKNIKNNTITIEIFKDISCSHCSSCDNKTHSIQTFKYYQKDLIEGDMIEFGGLLGTAPVMKVNKASSVDFINRGGQIPAPIHSFKN